MSENETKKTYSSVKIVTLLTVGWVGLMGLMGFVAVGLVNAGSDGDTVQIGQIMSAAQSLLT